MKMDCSNYFIKLIIILTQISLSLNICNDRAHPIFVKSSNSCEMKYCQEEEFEQKSCIKDNEIIRVQWLSNIIKFKQNKCRNPKFVKYEDGNIGIFTGEQSSNSMYNIINYYCLNEYGKISLYQFKKVGTSFAISTNGEIIVSFDDGEMLIIKSSINEVLIINIGKQFGEAELYDLQKIQTSIVFHGQTKDYFDNQIFTNIRGSLFNLKDSDYFIYAGLFVTYQSEMNTASLSSYTNEFALFKISISSKASFQNPTKIYSLSSEKFTAYGKMVSCFQTENKVIVCFYITSLTDKSYKIVTFNENFETVNRDFGISVNYIEENIFFKGIHYKDEIGAFLYYNINGDNIYPYIYFYNIKALTFEYKASLTLDKYQINYNIDLNLNDFMKISEEVLCFSTLSENRETLYIIILNIFSFSLSQIRYYKIETFGLYNFKFYMELRTELYMDYIALASSFCEKEDCDSLDDSYTSLIIFNYPNTTDVNKDITEEFSKNNVMSFEDLNFNLDLKDYVIIENNIFGYIYYLIIIKSFQNCENIEFTSLTLNSGITAPYNLMEGETINIKFSNTNFNSFNCTIEYVYEITESDYDKNLEYAETEQTQGSGEEIKDFFNDKRKIYSSRLSYYSLYFKSELTTSCSDNCDLCYDDSEKECITCKYNYIMEVNEDGTKQKKCLNEHETVPTEKPTEKIEDIPTVKITEKLENPKTQKLTEAIPTEEPPKIPTEKLTYKQTEIAQTDSLHENQTDKKTEKLEDKITENINKNTEKVTNEPTEIQKHTDLKTVSPTSLNIDLNTFKYTELPTFEAHSQAPIDITDSQTSAYTDKITSSKTDIQTDMKTDSQLDKSTDRETDKVTDSQTNTSTQDLTNFLSDTKTNIQIDDKTNIPTDITTNINDLTNKLTDFKTNIDDKTNIPTDIITNEDDTTNMPTDIITNKEDITNRFTDIITNKEDITNKPTDIITNEVGLTNKPTDIISNKDDITNKFTDAITNEDAITNRPTDTITNKNNITNKPTDVITSQKTDFLIDESIVGPTNIKSDINKDKQTNNITELTEKNINKNECTNEEIIASKCTSGTVNKDQFGSLHDQVKKEILNNETYHGENRIIITDNVAFQITKIDNQSSNEYSNLSSIDLGECEETLMKKCNVPEGETLIIYKTDIRSDNLLTTYVLYEVYHPITLEKLNLSLCLEDTISITVPVNLNNETLNLINSLNSSGYNVFNKSDSFYNDICTPYTTINGTDINLNDRQHIIEDTGGSLDLCQKGCDLIYFNSSSQKVICDCDLKSATTTINNIDEIQFSSNLVQNLFIGLKYSNYLVLKCYKLLTNYENLILNYGFIIMMIIIISLIILFFIYLIKGRKKIDYYLESILKNKLVYVNNRKSMKKSISHDKSNSKLNEINLSEHKKDKEKINEKNKEKNKKQNNEKYKEKGNKKRKSTKIKKEKEKEKKQLSKNKKNRVDKNNSSPPIKKKERKSKTKKMNLIDNAHKMLGNSISTQNVSKTSGLLAKNDIKNLNINIIPINHLNYKKSKKKKVIKAKIVNKISSKTSFKKGIDIFSLKEKKISQKNLSLRKTSKNKKVLDTDYINYNTLNISELNNLNYKEALLIDKRTYLQYYIALIRKKQLIIFTFAPIDDYNLISLKIALFILSLATYIAVNIFFFSDYTMHKIYTDNGYSDFIVHLPQIVYASIISSIIDTILKLLCLSENKILSIKEIKKIKASSYKRVNDTKIYLRIKFIFFFLISFLLSIFYCYFMSCYCAVYHNTQIILIKDTLMSYGLSMLYPFGLCLIPGVFRIAALRAVNKDKKWLYKFSQLISFV